MKNILKSNSKEKNNNVIISLLKGNFIGFIITFIVVLVYTFLITYTNISEKNYFFIIMATIVFSCIAAGFETAKRANKCGLLWGILSGLMFVILNFLISFIFIENFAFSTKAVFMLVLGIVAGGLGGIIGINVKK